MEEIKKARKEQTNALINIFSWASILVMLVGACVYGGLCGVYVYIWFLLPEMMFVTCGIVCNAINYFKARKKFNELLEIEIKKEIRERAEKAIDIAMGLNRVVDLVQNLEIYARLFGDKIETNKEEKSDELKSND